MKKALSASIPASVTVSTSAPADKEFQDDMPDKSGEDKGKSPFDPKDPDDKETGGMKDTKDFNDTKDEQFQPEKKKDFGGKGGKGEV